MTKDRHKRFLKNTDGAVAATYALALIPLIAIAGLAYDYTRMVGLDTELQNAADQAALAGASQLDRTAGSMQRAVNAIQGGLVSNSSLFSNDGSGATINVTNAATQIVFYSTRANAEAGTNGFDISTAASNDANAGFVEVIVDARTADYALTPVVGALSGNANAAAVAGLGSALCRVPPLMICNPDEATSSTMDVANRIGHGLLAKPGGGGQWRPGNYGYLDVGLANGAVGVRQALGWGSAGNCIAQNGPATVDTQTGNIANAPGSANTRFDVYENGACETGGDCPSAINVRKDMVRPVGSPAGNGKTCEVNSNQGGWRLPWAGNTGNNFEGDAYLPTDATATYTHTPNAMGHPRDICHAVYDGATGNCWDTDGNFGDGNWDRDAYFRSNYLRTQDGSGGLAGERWDSADWKANLAGDTIDVDGDGTIDITLPNLASIGTDLTRYQVYKWEEANKDSIVDGVNVLNPVPYVSGDSGTNLETRGESMCSAAHGYTPIATPDRRKMSVAVVNCTAEGVSGSSTGVNVVQWIDVFLVHVAADRQYNGNHWTGKDEMYVEIIAENTVRATGSNDGITIRRDVPYLVK